MPLRQPSEDEFGNVRAEDASGNVTFADDDGGGAIAATEFTSEIDLDYEGTGSDDEYDAGEELMSLTSQLAAFGEW